MTDEITQALRNLIEAVHSGGFPHKAIARAETALNTRTALAADPWLRVEDMPDEWKDGRPLELRTKDGLVYVGSYRGRRMGEPGADDQRYWRATCCGRYTHPTHARQLPPQGDANG